MARECKGELGSHFHPLLGTGLSWSLETLVTQGLMDASDDRRWMGTGVAYSALDWRPTQHPQHGLYLETGLKYWYRSAATGGAVDEPTRRHLWLREAFYRWEGDGSWFKAGLQSMNLAEGLLLDERVLGVAAMKRLGRLDLHLRGGSVATSFARMEEFCANRHAYQLLQGRRRTLVGDDLGETNLVGLSVIWTPGRVVARAPSRTDDTGADGFGFTATPEDFSAPIDTDGLIEDVGLTLMEEFGSGSQDYKYYAGGAVGLSLPADVGAKGEVVGQYISGQKAVGYLAAVERDRMWRNGGLTHLSTGYLGRYRIDSGAFFYPSFSNLFLGDLMRLDSAQMPVVYASLRHRFTCPTTPSVGAYVVDQQGGNHTREFDLTGGLRLLGNLRVDVLYSISRSDLLEGHTHLARAEMRCAL